MDVTITLPPETASLLREESARTGLPLEVVAARAVEANLRGQSSAPRFATAPALSAAEAALLSKINEGLPSTFWQRYRALITRREEGTLSEAEQEELVSMSDQVEEKNLHRTEHLLALAELRGISLTEVVEQLGLRPESVHP